VTDTFSPVTLAFKGLFTDLVINPLESILTSAPWWLAVGVVVLVAWYVSGRRASITAGVCLALVVLLGLWNHAMQTLASVLVATVITLALGVALGIVSARSDRTRAVLRPILDAAQTLPAFVYLIPAIALFAPSRFTAIVAAVIYAVPPVIRLVDIGIRGVSPTVMEAATASGSTARQLLWKVQLPLSRGALLAATNQGIVLVLAMVVIGGLVGAGALGYDVVAGFAQGEDFGKGLAAGTAIVLLGIALDRITQGAGGRRRAPVRHAG
jgi:glycine betaine/proline transport system permease protein